MSAIPEDVLRLAAEREEARTRRDFDAADALRDRILEAGFAVTDTADGPRLSRAEAPPPAPVARLRPADVPSMLDRPPEFDATAHWLVQGWPEDVERGIESFERHRGKRSVQHVVVDVTGEDRAWPEGCDVVSLLPGTGWGDARNAGMVRSLGAVVLIVDGSVEAAGDPVGPLAASLDDASVGVTGPYGIVTEDLHDFHESEGPDVDAIEGYLLAVRRSQVVDGLRFDRGFKFYRTADIELSFQVKEQGLRAVVTPVPVTRHEHRMWASTSEADRERLSKRNFYRFLNRWRGRHDLTVVGGERETF
jgi:cysteinyl-tRNA synthetase